MACPSHPLSQLPLGPGQEGRAWWAGAPGDMGSCRDSETDVVAAGDPAFGVEANVTS